MPKRIEIEERFWAKVDWTFSEDRCWPWLGANTDRPEVGYIGYGLFSLGPKGDRIMVVAHRIAYTLEIGEIPPGLQIDHLCRNRHCVNPGHLEAVTPSQNVLRGISAEVTRQRNNARTTCKQGHEFTHHNGRQRRCRICCAQWNRDYRARQKGAKT